MGSRLSKAGSPVQMPPRQPVNQTDNATDSDQATPRNSRTLTLLSALRFGGVKDADDEQRQAPRLPDLKTHDPLVVDFAAADDTAAFASSPSHAAPSATTTHIAAPEMNRIQPLPAWRTVSTFPLPELTTEKSDNAQDDLTWTVDEYYKTWESAHSWISTFSSDRDNFNDNTSVPNNMNNTYDNEPEQPAAGSTTPTEPAPPEVPKEETWACLICCEEFTKDRIVEPCKTCQSTYCTTCLKDMFTKACEDTTRMPPRCCVQLNLHIAKPYLTLEEAALFREKFEEWSTPKPFYCPVAACSAFISNRILQKSRAGGNGKGKQRVDSVVGTPTSPNVGCPKCRTDICTNCRQLAHPESVCQELAFGVDEETAKLLKRWGYKKCPKCGQGVRRMYGCNHMECYCGAHWCWSCQRSRADCDGECYDADDDEESDVGDSDTEDEEENRDEQTSNTNLGNEDKDGEAMATADGGANNASTGSSSEPAATAPAETPRRVRNLDAHSRHYWDLEGLDFGDEPRDDVADLSWDCRHDLKPVTVDFEEYFEPIPHASHMECTRCWTAIYPELNRPRKLRPTTNITVAGFAVTRTLGSAVTQRWDRIRSGRPRLRTPRRLVRRDASLGSTRSLPDETFEPMEDITYSDNGNNTVDTYGNIIASTDFVLEPQRRKSLDDASNARPTFTFDKSHHNHTHTTSDEADAEDITPFSFAYQCSGCALLLCRSCRDDEIDRLKAIPRRPRYDENGSEIYVPEIDG